MAISSIVSSVIQNLTGPSGVAGGGGPLGALASQIQKAPDFASLLKEIGTGVARQLSQVPAQPQAFSPGQVASSILQNPAGALRDVASPSSGKGDKVFGKKTGEPQTDEDKLKAQFWKNMQTMIMDTMEKAMEKAKQAIRG